MTHPQFDPSLPTENALPISMDNEMANENSEGAPEAPRRSPDSPQEPLRRRTAAKTVANTAANLSAAYMDRQSNRRYPPLNALSSTRGASAVLSQPANSGAFPKINLLGVDFDNVSKLDLLSKLKRGVVFTPNVDHLMKLRRDRDFASVYQTADYKVCDSQILIYAAKFLGKPLKAKLSGSDLFPWFCEYHRHNDQMKIFLLGGRKGWLERPKGELMLALVGRL